MSRVVLDPKSRGAIPPLLRRFIADHLDAIAAHFTDRPKVTLLLRQPGRLDGDVLLTSDTTDEVIEALRRLEAQ